MAKNKIFFTLQTLKYNQNVEKSFDSFYTSYFLINSEVITKNKKIESLLAVWSINGDAGVDRMRRKEKS